MVKAFAAMEDAVDINKSLEVFLPQTIPILKHFETPFLMHTVSRLSLECVITSSVCSWNRAA